jgi:hypothetical protein
LFAAFAGSFKKLAYLNKYLSVAIAMVKKFFVGIGNILVGA